MYLNINQHLCIHCNFNPNTYICSHNSQYVNMHKFECPMKIVSQDEGNYGKSGTYVHQ